MRWEREGSNSGRLKRSGAILYVGALPTRPLAPTFDILFDIFNISAVYWPPYCLGIGIDAENDYFEHLKYV